MIYEVRRDPVGFGLIYLLMSWEYHMSLEYPVCINYGAIILYLLINLFRVWLASATKSLQKLREIYIYIYIYILCMSLVTITDTLSKNNIRHRYGFWTECRSLVDAYHWSGPCKSDIFNRRKINSSGSVRRASALVSTAVPALRKLIVLGVLEEQVHWCPSTAKILWVSQKTDGFKHYILILESQLHIFLAYCWICYKAICPNYSVASFVLSSSTAP
jgi:hypothetical protein